MSRPRRAAWVALGIAAFFSVLLIVGAFVAPAYSWMGEFSSGQVTQGVESFVAVNGLHVLPVVLAPLLVTLAVGGLLWTARSWTRGLAWGLVGLLAAFNTLAMLSIGLFVLPITVSLIVACGTAGRPRGALPTVVLARPDL